MSIIPTTTAVIVEAIIENLITRRQHQHGDPSRLLRSLHARSKGTGRRTAAGEMNSRLFIGACGIIREATEKGLLRPSFGESDKDWARRMHLNRRLLTARSGLPKAIPIRRDP